MQLKKHPSPVVFSTLHSTSPPSMPACWSWTESWCGSQAWIWVNDPSGRERVICPSKCGRTGLLTLLVFPLLIHLVTWQGLIANTGETGIKGSLAEVGKDLRRLPDPICLFKQGHPEQVVQVACEDLQGGDCTASLGKLYQVLATHSDRTTRVVVCAREFLSWHQEPLKRAWLCRLCTFHWGIYRYKWDPSWTFPRLNSPSWTQCSKNNYNTFNIQKHLDNSKGRKEGPWCKQA